MITTAKRKPSLPSLVISRIAAVSQPTRYRTTHLRSGASISAVAAGPSIFHSSSVTTQETAKEAPSPRTSERHHATSDFKQRWTSSPRATDKPSHEPPTGHKVAHSEKECSGGLRADGKLLGAQRSSESWSATRPQ